MIRSSVHFKCCICGEETTGYGNDAWPVVSNDKNWGNRCCDECNKNKVIPARLQIMQNIYEKDPTFRPED